MTNYQYKYTLVYSEPNAKTELVKGFRNFVNTVWTEKLLHENGTSPTLHQMSDPTQFPMQLYRGKQTVHVHQEGKSSWTQHSEVKDEFTKSE